MSVGRPIKSEHDNNCKRICARLSVRCPLRIRVNYTQLLLLLNGGWPHTAISWAINWSPTRGQSKFKLSYFLTDYYLIVLAAAREQSALLLPALIARPPLYIQSASKYSLLFVFIDFTAAFVVPVSHFNKQRDVRHSGLWQKSITFCLLRPIAGRLRSKDELSQVPLLVTHSISCAKQKKKKKLLPKNNSRSAYKYVANKLKSCQYLRYIIPRSPRVTRPFNQAKSNGRNLSQSWSSRI